MTLQKLPEVLRALVEEQVEFIVFGAVALMAHGLTRATEDLDVFVRPEQINILRLQAALKRVYPNDSAIDEITYEDLAGEYPAIRYNAPDGLGIDIVSRLGEAYTYDDLKTQEMGFHGLRIQVATPAMLYQMKKDTLRWKDRFDAQALKERFELEDE